ncbi:MAG: SIS domain-containing protein [Bacteroidales bacterium]|nr:SIS domain-containing protein [Bacteroidales bacterium]
MNIAKTIEDAIAVKQLMRSDSVLHDIIQQAAEVCIKTFEQKGKVLLCGNGGSAADAQHIAAELSGRFYYDRDPLYAEALHVNTSYVTAVANDYAYDEIYARMVKAAGRQGDVLIGLSTSGNSANVIKAFDQARALGVTTIALTGNKGGKLASMADVAIKIPSDNTARIQEAHILVGHVICEIIEQTLFPKND